MKRPQKVSNVPKKEVFCNRHQKRRGVETPGIYIYIYNIIYNYIYIIYMCVLPSNMLMSMGFQCDRDSNQKHG